jgi:hypothetical protein
MNNRWIAVAAAGLMVVATASVVTVRAVGATPPSGGTQQTTAATTTSDDGIWLEDKAPEWHPRDEPIGYYEGHCQGDTPVITKQPERVKTPIAELKPVCEDGIFMTELIWKEAEVPSGPVKLAELPLKPLDYGQRAEIRLNGYHLSDPRREKDVFPYVTTAGRTVIPVRWLAEAAGARILWKQQTQEIEVHWKDRVVHMRVGDTQATVNGKAFTLEQPPKLVAGRTLVPVRFAAEGMGAQVTWDAMAQTVSITLAGVTCPPSYCVDRQEEVQAEYNAEYVRTHNQ